MFTVNHESQVSYGTNYFNVLVQDSSGNPVSDALVSMLIRFGDTPVNLFTDSNGEVLFDLNLFDSGLVSITVTKNNFKPYTGALNITNSNISMNIDSSQPILINDNNDGIPTAGEEFGISVPIINFGSQIVQSITATLTSYSNLINILNDQIFICLLYTSPSPRDLSTSRMPSSA